MVQSHVQSNQGNDAGGNASLEQLSRTLEVLETRLSRLAVPTAKAAPVAQKMPPQPEPQSPAAAPSRAAPSFLAAYGAEPARRAAEERRKPTLADAVSEIAMRRQMLDEAARPVARPARSTEGRASVEAPAIDPRYASLARQAETLRAEGSHLNLMADVAAELQRLRQEIRTEGAQRVDPRFDAMRHSFDDLRAMIETRQNADVIGAEMSEISASLARLTEEGADRAMLNTLRAELEEMRGLFGEMAKEKSVAAVGRRWDAFEQRYTEHSERESEARHDLKNELERLRESLRSLASQDTVRAVGERWDQFETRFMETPPAPSGDEISKLLRDELETMRGALEELSERNTASAVDDERWGALEKRLDRNDVETAIRSLAARMGEVETVLVDLPNSLGVPALEERMRLLASSVDALARRGQESDLEHFRALEERLDEISRAIVSASRQPAPVLDMAPIERIEARIALLSTRVDRLSDDDSAELLSMRIADLSDRVEELTGSAAQSETIAARMTALAERFDAAVAEMEQPRAESHAIVARVDSLAARFDAVLAELERPDIDTAVIEQRLSALALRLEDAGKSRDDGGMVRSLEAQIARLSDQIATVGQLAADDFGQEFDRRLALVEQRLDDNRDALIQAARQAADETALRMEAAGERRQSQHVAQLSENLRSLESLSRETDDRSNQVFDAVHSTLLKIVDRLEQIETEIGRGGSDQRPASVAASAVRSDRAAAHMAAASVPAAAADPVPAKSLRDVIARHIPGRTTPAQAATGTLGASALLDRPEPAFGERQLERVVPPSLDTSGMISAGMIPDSEVNRPLEPGSGAPDIGAMIERARLPLRSKDEGVIPPPVGEEETRAAARRAVKAAVAEAEMLRASTSGKSGKTFDLSELIARRRKTILVGVTAVLVALAALPVGKALMSLRTADVETTQSTRAPGTDIQLAASEPSSAKVALASPSANRPVTVPLASAPLLAPSTPVVSAPMPTSVAAPEVTAAPQTFVPMAETAANGAGDAAAILSSAIAKLPPEAAAATPATGTPALLSAVSANDPKAFFEIGLRLLEGRNADPKPAEAFGWFAKAASLGFAPAQYSLGTLFEKGNGVARDTVAARDWYLLAAEQGNVRAMHNLAVLYATGVDGKSEPETAAGWFEKAADYGMRDSQYNLGILYARGSGVEQSMADSYKWFAVVAKSGDKDAAEKRDEVGKSLAPDQLAAAEATVSRWTVKDRPEAANTVEVPSAWADAKADQTSSVDMTRAVRNIQAILGKLGYDAGQPDGVAGAKTTNAIAAFQKEAGLTPDGKINEPLIRALLQRKDG